MKTDLFQSYGHYWVFQIYWYIVCSTFTASSFRIWNSSAGIPSPPLALFAVMLPKAHLTPLQDAGSRWVATPSWLSGSWRPFLCSSSVCLCLLLLIACLCSVLTISLLCPSLHEMFPWYLQFSWRGKKKIKQKDEKQLVEYGSLEPTAAGVLWLLWWLFWLS